MPSKKICRITNTRKLTADEAVEARRLRELAAKDKSEIIAQGRRLLAEKRQCQAAAQGTPSLGQRIRAAREARGLTQADLAARALVAQGYLSYLEQDQREPSLSIAARIARELEIPLDELASGAAPAPKMIAKNTSLI
ncbi:MAG TPA: helix-turn-helix transcriptional regulator [Pirellulales bacterium]|nr:helix-turn-helix transcriptional regulator [Pirellulales bacterium]